jgi:hypothetical protein
VEDQHTVLSLFKADSDRILGILKGDSNRAELK